MRKVNILTTILLLLLAGDFLKAQVSGFVNGAAQADPNWSTGVHYMDGVRARVSNLAPVPLDPTSSDVTLSVPVGSFHVGDIAILIQMKGSGIGTHQNVKVDIVSTATSIRVKAVSGNILTYITAGVDDRVQLVKINEYLNFTLSGDAVVTCDPWDGETGGVLCMTTSGTLAISGGTFTVAGKGFTAGEAGVTFGLGGPGGTANPTNNFLASAQSPTQAFYYKTSCQTRSFTRRGTKGGSGTSGFAGTSNTGTGIAYGGSTFHKLLVMGDPGYYQAGYGGGNGSGGGGRGGNGNSSACNNPPTAGAMGGNGGPGGNAGAGGNGGGAMLIKASVVNITTADPVFIGSGENGFWGGNGSQGGTGGIGGAGGAACCPSVELPGGPGGNGNYGVGGQGGDGGNGGKAGYIWIAAQSYATSASPRSLNFKVAGGKGGQGGNGGFGGGNTTQSPFPVLSCTGEYCTYPPVCIYRCDPDRAMCLMATNARTAEKNAITGDIEFYDNVPALCAKYIAVSNTLESYDGCNTYSASWRTPVDPDVMFEHFVTEPPVNAPPYFGKPNFTVQPPDGTGCGAMINYPVLINFYDITGTIVVLTYNHASPGDAAYIEESGTANRTFVDVCPPPSGFGFVQASPGSGGENAPDGDIDTGDPTDNVVIEAPSSFRIGRPETETEITRNDLDLQVSPNPVEGEMQVVFMANSGESCVLTITDVRGRIVFSKKIVAEGGKNSLSISTSEFGKGIYLVNITSGEKTSRQKIIVK